MNLDEYPAISKVLRLMRERLSIQENPTKDDQNVNDDLSTDQSCKIMSLAYRKTEAFRLTMVPKNFKVRTAIIPNGCHTQKLKFVLEKIFKKYIGWKLLWKKFYNWKLFTEKNKIRRNYIKNRIIALKCHQRVSNKFTTPMRINCIRRLGLNI